MDRLGGGGAGGAGSNRSMADLPPTSWKLSSTTVQRPSRCVAKQAGQVAAPSKTTVVMQTTAWSPTQASWQ